LSFIGTKWSEAALLRAGCAFEQAARIVMAGFPTLFAISLVLYPLRI